MDADVNFMATNLAKLPVPLNVEENKLNAGYRLYKGLQRIVHLAEYFKSCCSALVVPLTNLDSAKRHDSILDDAAISSCGFSLAGRAYFQVCSAKQELEKTLKILDTVNAKIAGQLQGALKGKVGDRLLRHSIEAQNLIELLVRTSEALEPARTPYLIRQSGLSNLHREISGLTNFCSSLRRGLDKNDLPELLYSRLLDAETSLYKMRSSLGKWRDNPSQKMGAKVKELKRKTDLLNENLLALKADSLAYNASLGVKVFNRQGAVDMATEITRYESLS